MAAWICPTCRIHYGETQAGACPADGSRLVMNLSGAQLLGNTLTHLLHVGPDGATTWEASTAQGARVAMKLLRGPQDATAWSTAALLSHPRVVALRGYASIDDDLACVVMQWLEGRTLAETLAEGPLPLPLALSLTAELLDALDYVHGRDVAHGDLHAETVFIERGEHVKLLDVGVRRTRPLAEILGVGRRPLDWYTVLYAPPERLATGRQDARGDIYATGALLWHMCTGMPPFGVDPQSVARHHLTAPRPRLAEVRPEVAWPPALQALLDRAMAIRPEARFATAGELRAALQQVSAPARLPVPRPSNATVVAPMPTAPSAPVPSPPRDEVASSRTAGLAVAGAAVLLGGALMWVLAQDNPAERPSATLAGGAAGAPLVPVLATAPPPSLVEEVVRATPADVAPVTVAAPVTDAAPVTESVAAPVTAAPVTEAVAAPVTAAAPVTEAVAVAPASVAPASVAPASVAPASVAPASLAVADRAAPASSERPPRIIRRNNPAEVRRREPRGGTRVLILGTDSPAPDVSVRPVIRPLDR